MYAYFVMSDKISIDHSRNYLIPFISIPWLIHESSHFCLFQELATGARE